MKKGELKKKTGFTIIEVSLVLAIAGLIFLMVFIALPQLQRQQRDSRRRDDILSFLETVKKYQTNNRGALPEAVSYPSITSYELASGAANLRKTSWAGFLKDYLGENFRDPDGNGYKLRVLTCEDKDVDSDCFEGDEGPYDEPFPNGHELYVVVKATCVGERAVASSNPRKIAALYRLEGAGVYCANT